jgi:RpiR family transcriptional regulator, carbohydrate utilization regulator
VLTRTQARLAQLSNAERQVGEWILAHPQEALLQDTRTLARQVGVSQPTLVRFARSLGCAGFDDFRLELAREMGSRPEGPLVTLATIAASTDLDTLCRSLFDFSMAALGQVRDRLDRDALSAAVALLDEARQVMFFGYGNAASVADDARRRFLRLQMLVSAASDHSLQALAAGQLQRGDVLVLLSHSGLAVGLAELVSTVRGRDARVLAITTTLSPLAGMADVVLGIDVPDGGDALTPGTAQLAQLTVIDLLALAVANARATRAARRAARVLPRRRKGTAAKG